MSRMSVLAAHPKRVLGTLAVGVAAASVAVGSGASFTSASANPANTFSAGILSHTNSKSGAALLTAQRLKPGEAQSGTVTITNDGDIPGTFTLSKSALADSAGANGGVLSGKLTLRVRDVTNASSPTTVYNGTVAAMSSQSLGVFAKDEARTYEFTVTFPDGGTPATSTTGDNAYKGSSLTVQYDWNVVS